MGFHQATKNKAAKAGNSLIRVGEIEHLTGIPFDQQRGTVLKKQGYLYKNRFPPCCVLLKDSKTDLFRE